MDQPKLSARRCLLLCARSHPCSDTQLLSLLQEGVDWNYLFDQGGKHGLLPLAYERLHSLDGDLVPPNVVARLQGIYYANLRRNLRLQASLTEVVTVLQEAGIEPIVLKGAALAGTIYADPGLRPMTDLDLLVPPEAMERAGIAMASIGYRLSGGLTPQLIRYQVRVGGRLEWLREQYGQLTHMDLQHDLIGVDLWRHAFPIEPATLWAAARTLPLVRGQALQLSPEDTLIHLCLHSAMNHAYAVPFIGTVDLDWLVTREASDSFWRQLIERAERFRVGTIIYRGLCCAQEMLGTPVPAGTLKALAPGVLRQGLLERLAPLDEEHAWKGGDGRPNGLHEILLYAALMERPRDALGMVRAILFPGQEWLAVRYGLEGERQARLYRFIHPLRVARALLRALHRPLIQSGLE